MTEESPSFPPKKGWLESGWFPIIPTLGLLAAAAGTGFPLTVPEYHNEIRSIQYTAIFTSLFPSLIIASIFQPKEYQEYPKLGLRYTITIFVLIGGHLLWVQPIWAFHHDYSLGIFAWLFLGGENGFSISPSPIGFLFTIGASFGLLVPFRAFIDS